MNKEEYMSLPEAQKSRLIHKWRKDQGMLPIETEEEMRLYKEVFQHFIPNYKSNIVPYKVEEFRD